MWIFWILIVLVIVWLIALAFKSTGKDSASEKSALDILRERYARGEIDRDRFEQMKKDLDG